MSRLALIVAAVTCALGLALAQVFNDAPIEDLLEQLFPDASSFSAKEGNPPHYEAYGPARSGGTPELLGYAYWTTEIEPLERGYDGPIKMLVGLGPDGVIKGVIVTEHREPYGYFSVELPEFADQFAGKDIRDRFRVGEDIDAISRATITVTSASRAVRNSSRRIARAYLTPPAP